MTDDSIEMQVLYKKESSPPPNPRKKHKIILIGLAIHLLLLTAVFDIYFSSPIEQGMVDIPTTEDPPAERVVLIIGDGLRSEAVFSQGKENLTPFLNSIIDRKGSWGVSHTRVPTESRPGHVAILAGIYEDPSAIFKGWKANPVNFDSVVNRSKNAWCWGSQGVVDIFNKDNLPHINVFSYDYNSDDFADDVVGQMDMWVFKRVSKFLKKIQKCKEDCEKYHQKGNFFFLHLLGIDTVGHGYKPTAKEYAQNIKLVDSITKNIYEMFETTFKNDTTAYIFTSDHGMTDWGSHGSGSTHETEVPFVTWGAGIQQNRNKRHIEQINIAPLIASLLGLVFPTNSLGVVPVELLDTSPRNIARMALRNSIQVLEILKIKMDRIQSKTFIFWKGYKDYTSDKMEAVVSEILNMFRKEQYDLVTQFSKKFIELMKEGIVMCQNYIKNLVVVALSIGLICWILLLVLYLFDKEPKRIGQSMTVAFLVCNIVLAVFCVKEELSVKSSLYLAFPLVMINVLARYVTHLVDLLKMLLSSKRNILTAIVYIVGIELLVYGFFNRLSFSFLMLLIGTYVFISKTIKENAKPRNKIVWLILCCVLTMFPMFPVMRTTFTTKTFLSGFSTWSLCFYNVYCSLLKTYSNTNFIKTQCKIILVQFFCFTLAAIYVLLIEFKFIVHDSHFKWISWLIFIVPIILVPFSTKCILARLATLFFSFVPFYALVSPNYELFFSAIYASILCEWIFLESRSHHLDETTIVGSVFDNYKPKKFTSGTIGRSFIFLTLIFMGFFGTGNIASLNSFDPMWVRAFLTVYSPFKMAGLILLKVMVPIIFACCVFRAINFYVREDAVNSFCSILIFSDLMLLQFFCLITNVGSWLDIGSSFSHFVIMEMFVLVLMFLYSFAGFLMKFSYFKCYKQ